jgi:WD40 repeat protein
MNPSRFCALALLTLALAVPARADDPPAPPGGALPVLRLEAGGPTALVNALAFKSDGDKLWLYAAGWDKVVRAWALEDDRFVLKSGYRVPLGPGTGGVVNALALSPDGRWLAVAGRGPARGEASSRDVGMIVPQVVALSPGMREDQGTIYLFDTTTGAARPLRGHLGPVLSLAFAPRHPGKPPLLVSAASEPRGTKPVGVVRLWDASRGELLGQTRGDEGLADPSDRRPGLAAWHTGKGPRDLRVALAWRDGTLRVWDVGRGRVTVMGDEGRSNDTVAFLDDRTRPGGGTLLTGSYGLAARLREWDIAGAARKADPKQEVALDAASYPRALTLLASRPGGKPDHAAVVLRSPLTVTDPAKVEYQLQVVALAPGCDFGAVKAAVRLWTGGVQYPVVAASPDGRYLAAAGNQGHTILVFDTGDLLAGRDRPVQTLRGVGATMREAVFVRKDKQRGLRLAERPPGKATLIFDLAGRRLTDEPEGWEEESPRQGAWDAGPRKNAASAVVGFDVKRGDKPAGKVRLPAGAREAVWALLPPGKSSKDPLLAVAFRVNSVPYLALYDVPSGRQLRQYTGHLDPIRSLSFSADGRLLASAADDQTVCVWSLADLDEVQGRRGLLYGFVVQQEGKKADLRLARLDDDLDQDNRAALDQKRVRVGDVIEGLVEDGKLRPLTSPLAFHEAVWNLHPRQKVTLRVGDRGDVALRVGQAIDERKPLFSLFVAARPQLMTARAGPDAGGVKESDRAWVGWSPNGFYDASDQGQAEGYVGWHRNTGKPEEPTSFSPAAAYRKEYRREGLLARLVEHGRLAPALKAWKDAPAPPPTMGLRIEEIPSDHPHCDPQGHPVVQSTRLTLAASVYGLPPGKLDQVRWEFDDGKPLDFDRASGKTWTADLSKLPWGRGLHKIRLLVRTVSAPPVDHTRTLYVHYLPPRPAVALDGDGLRKEVGGRDPDRLDVRQVELRLKGKVTRESTGPGTPAVRVTLLVDKEEKVIHDKKVIPAAGLAVDHQLKLRPGENRLELRAENEGASADPELKKYEAASQVLVVRYTPKAEVKPPQVLLQSVVSADTGPVPPADEALVVHTRRVRVRGRITAEQDLTEATRDGRALQKFTPARGLRTLAIEEDVELQPGKQRLTFAARTAESRAETKALLIDYQPDLPRFQRTAPEARDRKGDEPLQTRLEGRLLVPDDSSDYSVRVRVNGREVPAGAVEVDKKERRLAAPLVLRPGDNRIEVVLSNKYWSRPPEEIRAYCQRPPRITRFEKRQDDKRPLVDLTALVETAADLPLDGAWLNDRPLGPDEVRRGAVAGPTQTWHIRVKGAPLAQGDNRFRLRVRNRDGECLEPKTLEVRHTGPLPPPAEVTILSPAQDMTVDVPAFRLRFQVQSTTPLERLEVWHKEKWAAVNPARADAGTYEVPLTLEPGGNVLKVRAVNGGGPAESPERTVSYTRRTVHVRLERLEWQDGPKRPKESLEPDRREGNVTVFGRRVPVAEVWLNGYVEWPEGGPRPPEGAERVHVWVNDFEQFEAVLQKARPAGGGWRRPFRAELRLNQVRNRVKLGFAEELKVEAAAPEVVVACDKPERDRRLHLLVVGPRERKQEALREWVLKALGARNRAGYDFDTPAFHEATLYGPLPWDVNPNEIFHALEDIKKAIRNRGMRGRDGPIHDVVLVYFVGEELIDGQGHFLVTDPRRWAKDRSGWAVDCEHLREILAEVQGAKLLLLDVCRGAGGPADRVRVPRWAATASPPIGAIRHVWLGKGVAPEDYRLLKALEVTLARAGLFGDVKRQIRQWAQGLDKEHPVFTWFAPGVLDGLQLGGKP